MSVRRHAVLRLVTGSGPPGKEYGQQLAWWGRMLNQDQRHAGGGRDCSGGAVNGLQPAGGCPDADHGKQNGRGWPVLNRL